MIVKKISLNKALPNSLLRLLISIVKVEDTEADLKSLEYGGIEEMSDEEVPEGVQQMRDLMDNDGQEDDEG
jgi:hypothetical protein